MSDSAGQGAPGAGGLPPLPPPPPPRRPVVPAVPLPPQLTEPAAPSVPAAPSAPSIPVAPNAPAAPPAPHVPVVPTVPDASDAFPMSVPIPASTSTVPPTTTGADKTSARRMWLVIGAAAAAVVVAGAALAIWLPSLDGSRAGAGDRTPDSGSPASDATVAGAATVEAYLGALVDGDAESALELFPADDTRTSQVLLDNEVYAHATHPTGYTITDGTRDGSNARVSASVEVGGHAYPVTFELTRTSGDIDTVSGWEITSGPSATVEVGDIRAVSEINGVSVDLKGVAPGSKLPALPGTYVFAAPAATTVLTFGDDVTVRVGLDGQAAQSVSFEATFSEAGRQQATDAVRARVESCMISDQFKPRDCPVALAWADPGIYAVSKLTRSWSTTPDYAFVESASTPSGYAVRVTGGDLRIDYVWRYAEGDPWTSADDQITNIFNRYSTSGTLVPVSVDPTTGLVLDFSAF